MTREEEIKEIEHKLAGYETFIKEIADLKARKALLKKQIKDEEFVKLPFEEQFEKWLGTGKEEIPYVPSDHNGFPKLRELMDHLDWEFHRHKTYDIGELAEWEYVYDIDERIAALTNGSLKMDTLDLYIAAAKEIMAKDLGSVEWDW